jgi:hypothetical protein
MTHGLVAGATIVAALGGSATATSVRQDGARPPVPSALPDLSTPGPIANAVLPHRAAAMGSGPLLTLAEQSMREIEDWFLSTRERT